MPGLEAARQALADAVTSGGLQTLPYPPDNPSPPVGFIDDVAIDFTGTIGGAGTFCTPGSAIATIVTIAQRNDRPGSMSFLESLIAPVLDALQDVPGVRIVTASSGQITVGGQDIPSVTYVVSFFI